jgi:hypothetical protein
MPYIVLHVMPTRTLGLYMNVVCDLFIYVFLTFFEIMFKAAR